MHVYAIIFMTFEKEILSYSLYDNIHYLHNINIIG